MAGETTPPSGATRFIETTRGVLSYAQLAPLLAERVLGVERAIASDKFAAQPLAPGLILQLHTRIAGDLSFRIGRGGGAMLRCASDSIIHHYLTACRCLCLNMGKTCASG